MLFKSSQMTPDSVAYVALTVVVAAVTGVAASMLCSRAWSPPWKRVGCVAARQRRRQEGSPGNGMSSRVSNSSVGTAAPFTFIIRSSPCEYLHQGVRKATAVVEPLAGSVDDAVHVPSTGHYCTVMVSDYAGMESDGANTQTHECRVGGVLDSQRPLAPAGDAKPALIAMHPHGVHEPGGVSTTASTGHASAATVTRLEGIR